MPFRAGAQEAVRTGVVNGEMELANREGFCIAYDRVYGIGGVPGGLTTKTPSPPFPAARPSS